MNLDDTPELQAFRRELREFLSTHLPADLRAKVTGHLRLTREDFVRWHRIVHARGWAGASWPTVYGGTGWTALQQHIWDEECSQAGAPIIQPFGVNMVAPVIMAYGNEAQKRYYLPRILSCEDWWCQGYSEPGAGSDLAALRLKAQRQGDDYILNGQKTWTTMAQHANMMFCLVRTNSEGRKQEGISFLLVDMRTPGITVRPIHLMNGEADVNDVFFEDVAVPVENLIGVENQGWTYAKYLLGHERTSIAGVGRSKRELRQLKQLAAKRRVRGRSLMDDPVFADQVARLEIDLMALEITVLRVAAESSSAPGALSSMIKITGTEMQQRLTELMVKAAGPGALAYDTAFLDGHSAHSLSGDDEAAGLVPAYLTCRATTIYGGSTEVQKNIIAQHVLGL
ncbi:acyl-CoA dehydrogenase family protein [Ottowia thiooxydans]|uniref:Alkylation response protein AidB-like acyl-CoA dehydrogenase n=1 Tax=Ottowia thiooxydans TaxID=219182 RepID=A0ABV2QIV7_9BURK